MPALPYRVDLLASTPGLRPLLPALYVAWADLQLSDAEQSRLHDLAQALPGLDDTEHAVLEGWLNPEAPPTARELSSLRKVIREGLGDAQPEGGLRALGEALAPGDEQPRRDVLDAFLAELTSIAEAGDHDAGAALWRPRSPSVDQRFAEPEPPFSTTRLRDALDGRWKATWDDVRALLADPAFRHPGEVSKEQHREQVMRWLAVLAERGYGSLAMPARLGGRDDMGAFVQTFAALAQFDLSLVVKFGVQFGLFGGAILFLGTEEQQDRYLPAVGSLQLPGGFAMTETGHGSNVRDLETTATFDVDDDCFVLDSPSLSARKEWIGNAAVDGRAMVVFAQLITDDEEYGVHAFFVPVRDAAGATLPGVHIEDCGHKMGLNGVDNGRIRFDGVRVPRANLLGRYATVAADGTYSSPISSDNKRFFTMLGTLVGGRISVAAAGVTASKSALTIAIRYGALRRQFGPAGQPEMCVLDYLSHQLRLMPALAATWALHFAVNDLLEVSLADDSDDARDVETLAAGIKAAATWHAIDACQAARECCGGSGFLSANRIPAIRTDVDVFATFEGDNTVLMQLLARNLLTSYARGFQYDMVGTVLRQLTRRARRELTDRNPFVTRRRDDEHLRDAAFHLDVLEIRSESLLAAAARRVRKRIEGGMDGFLAFNEVQDHLLALAHAWVDHRVARSFAAAVDAMPAGPERDAMERLRALDAVTRIKNAAEWYVENGYMQPDKSRALRKTHTALCREVREHAVALTDAFGIPDSALSAPIAFEDYASRDPL